MKIASFLLQVTVLKSSVFSLASPTDTSDLNQTTVCPQHFEPSDDGRCLRSTNYYCPTDLVVLSLNDTALENQFRLVDNFTAFRRADDGTFIEGVDVVGFSEDGEPLICNGSAYRVRTFFVHFPPGYLELTYIGCSLSVIGSSLVLITYGLFKEL